MRKKDLALFSKNEHQTGLADSLRSDRKKIGDNTIADFNDGAVQIPGWFLRAIEQRPDQKYIGVDSVVIEYLTWGELGKPGLLFLHGNMAHAHWWSFIAPFFRGRYRIAAVSFSGMGNSDHREAYNHVEFAKEAIAVADAAGLMLCPTPPVVIAHSAGGGPAITIAAGTKMRCSGVILIDTLVIPDGDHHDLRPTRQHAIYATLEEALTRFRLMPEQPQSAPYIVDWLARHSLRRTFDGIGWTWRADAKLRGKFTARGAWQNLPAVTCPLFFINGALSSVTLPERINRMRRHAPAESVFITIPEAHHHVMVDQPIALVTAIATLLEARLKSPQLEPP